jgi:HSP20 family protein
MTNHYSLCDSAYSIYPGDYVPLIKVKEIQEELKQHHEKEYLPMNLKELKNEYVVEVAIPGVNRENILVEATENILSICMLQKDCDMLEGADFILHKSNCRCFDRKIILPNNVDTEFIDAHYSAGMLRFHIPKMKICSTNKHTPIVIY